MTLFLDTANFEEIKEIVPWGVIRGITTNPKILFNSGISYEGYKELIKCICRLVNGPVSVELTKINEPVEVLFNEGVSIASLDRRINVKVPMWGDGKGLQLIKELTQCDIEVNATCMMNAIQGVLASEAGADFVSLFYNRMIDEAEKEYAQSQIIYLRNYIDEHLLDSQIIAGSIRKPKDVIDCFSLGAHIVTVPYKHMIKLPFHTRTESTIREFDEAWKEFMG